MYPAQTSQKGDVLWNLGYHAMKIHLALSQMSLFGQSTAQLKQDMRSQQNSGSQVSLKLEKLFFVSSDTKVFLWTICFEVARGRKKQCCVKVNSPSTTSVGDELHKPLFRMGCKMFIFEGST